MKRFLALGLGLLFTMAAPAAPNPSPAPSPARLYWKNGDSVTGELTAAAPEGLTWKTPLFADPLQLGWPAVRKIETSLAPAAVTEPFSVALRDGSFLYGDLTAVTKDSVTIHSARHGDAVLQRSEVLNVRRLRGGNLVFAGPTGDVGWSVTDDLPSKNRSSNRVAGFNVAGQTGTGQNGTSSPMSLRAEPGGRFSIPYWNRSAYLDLTLPKLVDCEFHLRSTQRPEFQLALQGDDKEQLRIETWDDDLVLTAGDQFQVLQKIDGSNREVALRVCWDRAGHKCSVFTPAGEPLVTDWPVGESSQGNNSALALKNKCRNLSLDFLRVRLWDGKPVTRLDPKKSHLELADGRRIEGEIGVGSSTALTVQGRGAEKENKFPLSAVDALVFSSAAPPTETHDAVLSYADGALLMGKISSLRQGQVALQTTFTSAPLLTQLTALRKLLIDVPEPAAAASASGAGSPGIAGTIVIQDTTLHGEFTTAGDAEPRWKPVGGLQASMPSPSLAQEIDFPAPSRAAAATTPTLFYLGSGDVLPGTLRSLDKTGVELDSSVITATKLAGEDLDAIQFGAAPRQDPHGFDDAGWRILKGDEKSGLHTGATLKMPAETAIGFPSLLQCSEINFTFDANNSSTVRLRLFCQGLDPARSTNLVLSNMFGDRFFSGLENTEGQIENEVRSRYQAGEAVAVRLVITEKQVELYVNHISVQKFPIQGSARAGDGLIIEPGSVWGNPVRPISLSGFSAMWALGGTWLPNIANEIKWQTLTVPRFRKNDLPRHALLAANGDVLRGEVAAVTATHLAFRSGLEELTVPRDRVPAVIWLKRPDDHAASAPANPGSRLLEQKIAQRTTYGRASLSSLLGFLRRQEPKLKFKGPEKSDARSFRMQFESQTLGEALGQICALFGLRYHFDADGTILLEASATTPENLRSQSYWLHAGQFPDTPSAPDLLTAKGLTFPAGATAVWEPRARLLTMTNTTENQAKLVEILASDFGGSLGSPTHWLLLSNGARLGLAVDKFDREAITGHHPIYGSCTVPMAEISSIRTTAPEPTATMKALADWRLVFAPDPVLPETGGGSSPLIGKAASIFKLPLLDGGDFDLAKEKGKVIVLDFWATWCGPCIKSLPGLMEAMAKFPADRVKLIGVNQSEAAGQVKRFLETRGWKLAVALDAGQNVGRQYGAEAIPHTVIIGPDGKVAWVETGYNPDGESAATDAVKRLLN